LHIDGKKKSGRQNLRSATGCSNLILKGLVNRRKATTAAKRDTEGRVGSKDEKTGSSGKE
jgi:hypothetical protein